MEFDDDDDNDNDNDVKDEGGSDKGGGVYTTCSSGGAVCIPLVAASFRVIVFTP